MATIKVLLVEDELRLAEYVKKGLEESGFTVDVAFDGQIGKSMALTNDYDLLVFDVNLPKISGIDLTKKTPGRTNQNTNYDFNCYGYNTRQIARF
jgi:two-component system copper resistance phosphate regulon response regulator CusR